MPPPPPEKLVPPDEPEPGTTMGLGSSDGSLSSVELAAPAPRFVPEPLLASAGFAGAEEGGGALPSSSFGMRLNTGFFRKSLP